MKKRGIALLLSMLLVAVLLTGCSSSSKDKAPAAGPAWPTKPIQVIVPAGAGGDTDFNARTMAKYFEKLTGKPMVITNMGGGGGSIATSNVKDAKPDGNTILFGHTGQVIVNEVAGLVKYSMDSFDIACIPGIDKGTVLVASKKSGITSVKDLIAKAKEKPGTIIYGTELGGYSHLQGLILQNLANIKLKIVDTGSASEKVASLLAGRIDIGAITYGAVQDYQKTGELVIIAQYNDKRNPLLGDIPTFKENGVDFAMEKPYIIAFPKGTDPAIVKKMAELSEQITKNPDYAKDLEKGFKQPVDYLSTKAAIDLLQKTRNDYMKYREALQQKK